MHQVIRYEEMPWIDLYSEPDFQGQLYRLRPNPSNGSAEFRAEKLPKFRSVIVGPRVTAELYLRGRAEPIKLRSKTIMPVAPRQWNRGQLRGLLLATAA